MGGNRPHRRHDLATCSDVFNGKTVCIRDLGKPNLIGRFKFKFDPNWSFYFKKYKSFHNYSTHFFDQNLSATLWYTLYVCSQMQPGKSLWLKRGDILRTKVSCFLFNLNFIQNNLFHQGPISSTYARCFFYRTEWEPFLAHKFAKIWHSHFEKFSTVVWQNSAVFIPYRTTYFTRGQFRQHMLAAFSLEQNKNLFGRTNLPKFGTVIWWNSAQLFGKIQQF